MSARRNNFFKSLNKKEHVCISFYLKNYIEENASKGKYKIKINKDKIIFPHKYYLKKAGFKLLDTRFHTIICWHNLPDIRKSNFYNIIHTMSKENDK